MNKSIKGVLAIGAATVLLLGGAGSLAYWQSQASTEAATFTTGTLAIEANDDGGWTRDGVAVDPETALLIPGDVLEYTQTFDITATGDDLLVTADMVDSAVTKTGDWSSWAGITVRIDGDPDVISPVYGGEYEVKKSGEVTVVATLSISAQETGGKNATLAAFAGDIQLTQVAALPVNPCAC